MDSAGKTFVVTLCGFVALFIFSWSQINSNSGTPNEFGHMIGNAIFRSIAAGIVTGLIASWLKLSWGGIVTLFVITVLVISGALNARMAHAESISVDGDWVGQGARAVCGNSTGSVPVSATVATQPKQAGCPDCLPTTYITLNVNGESINQMVNVAPDGALNSGLNNGGLGGNLTNMWYVKMRREGGAFSGYRLVGMIERMNYHCNNFGDTGEQLHLELHRP
jgi:hypothetical protein